MRTCNPRSRNPLLAVLTVTSFIVGAGRAPYYHFDFQHKGTRFYGSTGCTSKREAEAFERAERDRAKQQVKSSTSAVSTKLDDIAGRYWNEVGQHHAGSDTTWRDIERLIGYFGEPKLLTEIQDDDVAKLFAWRRGHRVKDHRKEVPKSAPPLPLVSNATVNRSTTEVLKKLFTRAKAWGHPLRSGTRLEAAPA